MERGWTVSRFCYFFLLLYFFCIREKARPLQWEGGDAVLRRAPECFSDSITMVAVPGRAESSPNPCDHLLWGNCSHLFLLSQSISPRCKMGGKYFCCTAVSRACGTGLMGGAQ